MVRLLVVLSVFVVSFNDAQLLNRLAALNPFAMFARPGGMFPGGGMVATPGGMVPGTPGMAAPIAGMVPLALHPFRILPLQPAMIGRVPLLPGMVPYNYGILQPQMMPQLSRMPGAGMVPLGSGMVPFLNGLPTSGMVPPSFSTVGPGLLTAGSGMVPPGLGRVPPGIGMIPPNLGMVPPSSGMIQSNMHNSELSQSDMVPPNTCMIPNLNSGMMPPVSGMVPPQPGQLPFQLPTLFTTLMPGLSGFLGQLFQGNIPLPGGLSGSITFGSPKFQGPVPIPVAPGLPPSVSVSVGDRLVPGMSPPGMIVSRKSAYSEGDPVRIDFGRLEANLQRTAQELIIRAQNIAQNRNAFLGDNPLQEISKSSMTKPLPVVKSDTPIVTKELWNSVLYDAFQTADPNQEWVVQFDDSERSDWTLITQQLEPYMRQYILAKEQFVEMNGRKTSIGLQDIQDPDDSIRSYRLAEIIKQRKTGQPNTNSFTIDEDSFNDIMDDYGPKRKSMLIAPQNDGFFKGRKTSLVSKIVSPPRIVPETKASKRVHPSLTPENGNVDRKSILMTRYPRNINQKEILESNENGPLRKAMYFSPQEDGTTKIITTPGVSKIIYNGEARPVNKPGSLKTLYRSNSEEPMDLSFSGNTRRAMFFEPQPDGTYKVITTPGVEELEEPQRKAMYQTRQPDGTMKVITTPGVSRVQYRYKPDGSPTLKEILGLRDDMFAQNVDSFIDRDLPNGLTERRAMYFSPQADGTTTITTTPGVGRIERPKGILFDQLPQSLFEFLQKSKLRVLPSNQVHDLPFDGPAEEFIQDDVKPENSSEEVFSEEDELSSDRFVGSNQRKTMFSTPNTSKTKVSKTNSENPKQTLKKLVKQFQKIISTALESQLNDLSSENPIIMTEFKPINPEKFQGSQENRYLINTVLAVINKKQRKTLINSEIPQLVYSENSLADELSEMLTPIALQILQLRMELYGPDANDLSDVVENQSEETPTESSTGRKMVLVNYEPEQKFEEIIHELGFIRVHYPAAVSSAGFKRFGDLQLSGPDDPRRVKYLINKAHALISFDKYKQKYKNDEKPPRFGPILQLDYDGNNWSELISNNLGPLAEEVLRTREVAFGKDGIDVSKVLEAQEIQGPDAGEVNIGFDNDKECK